jgi:phosphotransferase system  glucose/maltose/N-acetylglucosamine-specific IIC component
MRVKEEFTEAQRRFGLLSFYDKFEHIVILILTLLIAVFIVFAIWNLALKIVLSIATSGFDPTNYAVFQAVFGMPSLLRLSSSGRCSWLPSGSAASSRSAPWS